MRARGAAKPPESPLATVTKIKSAQRLAAVDACAAALGLKPGMTLPDARAMRPSLICVESDAEAEAEALANIADWCRRFTPLAALDAPDGLMLDVSGATHLFGGETKLLAEIEARLEDQGFCARAALAPTPEAAWALARYGALRILPSDLDEKEIARRFADLPLAALRLDAATLADLAQAGLRRIGDVMMRPRAPIAARCGDYLYARLDGLLGRAKAAISPRFEAPPYLAERRFLEGVARREDVEATILSLAHDLSELLARHGEGARRLEASLFRVDGAVKRFEVGASRPLREAQPIARLFRERIEAAAAAGGDDPLEADYGFDVIRLAVLSAERRDEEQADWSGGRGDADLADLIDRLGARLGLRRVTRLAFNAAHAPEFAVAATPAAHSFGSPSSVRAQAHRKPPDPRETPRLKASSKSKAGETTLAAFLAPSPAAAFMEEDAPAMILPARPIRLLRRPEPIETIACAPDGPPLRFRWRKVTHELAAVEGPERIAPDWRLSEAALSRDYFRAEDTEGRRFWLFREGLFNRETALPRWFMHGLFA
nr:DNA polymerase Y family protein [Methylocapsa acidiphila]